MATQWDNIAIPLQGGIDTKTDAKAAAPTSFVELENCVFTKRGSLEKRHGYDLVPTGVNAEVIGRNGDSLLVLSDQNAYAYNPDNETLIDKGFFNRVEISSSEVESGSQEITLADQADVHGITVRAYLSTAGGMEVSVSDTLTGAVYKRLTGGIVGTGNRPRVVRVGDFVHVVFAVGSSTNLYSLPVNPWTPADTVDADVIVIASDLHANEVFDVVSNSEDTNALFAWYSSGGSTLRYGRLFQDGTTGTKSDEGTAGAITCLSIAVNSSVMLMVFYDTATNQTRGRFVRNVNSILSPLGGDDKSSRTSVKVSAILSETQYFWLEEYALPTDHEDQTVTCVYGDVSELAEFTNEGFLSPAVRHCGIGSRGFVSDGKLYFFLKHESAKQLQNGYFLMQATPSDGALRVIGHAGLGEGTALIAEHHLPSFAMSTAGVVKGLLPFQRRAASTNNDAFLHKGALEISVDTTAIDYEIAEAGDTAYVSGGMLWAIDGKEPTESGFLLFPEPDIDFGADVHSFVDVASAGALPAGTYGYKIFYEFTSDSGEKHVSTALPFSVVVLASRQVEITIPTLDMTLRGLTNSLGARSEVSIAVFRTSVDGTVYHRCSGIDPSVVTGDNRYILNDRDANSVTFVDDMLDAVLETRQIDPSTGTLDNVAPPSAHTVVATQRRLFFLDDTNRVRFSKLRIEGQPIEFNDALYFDMPERGGANTALFSMSDAIGIFKNSQLYVVSGEGPNNLGLGGYAEPIQAATDVGCTDSRSLVEVPQGYMFKSEKGLYLLNKSFQVTYAGANVERFNGQLTAGSSLIPDRNLIVFLSPDGTSLAYDYYFDSWGTFTAHEGISSTEWDGKYCYLRADGSLMVQNPLKFKDGNVPFRLRARTGPLRIDGLQGRWRCKRIYLLGEYFSEHSLRLNLFFDRETAPRESVLFEPADFIDVSTWGDNATWGSGETWGGALEGRDYQVSYAPARQKCQSLSLEFVELPGQESGKSLELSELGLRYGQEREGMAGLPANRRK